MGESGNGFCDSAGPVPSVSATDVTAFHSGALLLASERVVTMKYVWRVRSDESRKYYTASVLFSCQQNPIYWLHLLGNANTQHLQTANHMPVNE